MIKKCALALTLCCSQAAVADDYFSLPDQWNTNAAEPLMLASSDATSITTMATENKNLYKDRLITANKLHKYLGIGSIGAALITTAMPKEEDGAHEALGKTAAALGVGAVITGFIFHWDEIDLGNGFSDPDNLHLALTTLGTVGFLTAVGEAPAGHAGPELGGAASMAIGIKIV